MFASQKKCQGKKKILKNNNFPLFDYLMKNIKESQI